jgi:hypothetical protein
MSAILLFLSFRLVVCLGFGNFQFTARETDDLRCCLLFVFFAPANFADAKIFFSRITHHVITVDA